VRALVREDHAPERAAGLGGRRAQLDDN
jgi:hypothetical protein